MFGASSPSARNPDAIVTIANGRNSRDPCLSYSHPAIIGMNNPTLWFGINTNVTNIGEKPETLLHQYRHQRHRRQHRKVKRHVRTSESEKYLCWKCRKSTIGLLTWLDKSEHPEQHEEQGVHRQVVRQRIG